MPFVATGALAILAGGGIAAAIAHDPARVLVWMVAYLVLVAGAMQVVFGAGQAWLATVRPGRGLVWSQWVLFNLGSVGVVAGTLGQRVAVVAAGTLLFMAALAGFFLGTRRCRWRGWGAVYRVLLGLVFLSACVGLALSFPGDGG